MSNTSSDLKVPFGERDGRLYAPTEVMRGLKCECRCPECKSRLVANHGETKRSYFSHHDDPECAGGYETALHKKAKQIIQDASGVMIPSHSVPIEADLIKPEPLHDTVLFESRWCDLTQVHAEQSVDIWRPDLNATLKNNESLYIEIAVTHSVEDAKAKALDNLMEIDLSRLDPEVVRDPEALRDAVLQTAPRSWYRVSLFDNLPKVQHAQELLQIEASKRIKQIERERAEKKQREDEQQRFAERREIERQANSSHIDKLNKVRDPKIQKDIKNKMADHCQKEIVATRERLGVHVGIPDALPPGVGITHEGDWIVRTHPVIWHALVLEHFIIHSPIGRVIPVKDVVNLIDRQFGFIPWMKELAKMKREHKRQGRERGAWYGESGVWFLSRAENATIKNPYHVMLKYLRKLTDIGYTVEQKEGSTFQVVNNDIRRTPKPSVGTQSQRRHFKLRQNEPTRQEHAAQSAMQYSEEQRERREEHFRDCKEVMTALLSKGIRQAQICSYCHMLTDKFTARLCPHCQKGELASVDLSDEYIKSYPHRIRCRPSRMNY